MRTRTEGSEKITQEVFCENVRGINSAVTTSQINSEWFYPDHTVCKDEIHRNYPKEGGPFSLQRVENHFSDSSVWSGIKWKLPTYKRYDYFTAVRAFKGSGNPIPPAETEACSNYGATAWERFKPAKPEVSMGQFLLELRSFGDMAFRELKNFQSFGRNYLAVEFGWKPFLRDILDWWESLKQIDQQIAQLKRDNGRWIKRGGSVKSFSNTTTKNLTSTSSCYPTNYLMNVTGVKKTTVKEDVWFSGSFRYYIPELNSRKWGTMRSLIEIWDIKAGPEQIYNVIPFSWLADWFSNAGSVIGNLQSAMEDRLVAKYAYVMRHTETRIKTRANFTARQSGYYSTDYVSDSCSSETLLETKERAVANPFGFNIFWPDLSVKQKSILFALGLMASGRGDFY